MVQDSASPIGGLGPVGEHISGDQGAKQQMKKPHSEMPGKPKNGRSILQNRDLHTSVLTAAGFRIIVRQGLPVAHTPGGDLNRAQRSQG